MASYNAAEPHDRWKAIVAVAAVHACLAAIIVAGLNVQMVGHAVEQLKTFDFRDLPLPPPVPPPPPPPKPAPKPAKAKKPEGAPARKAEPTPVVAPPSPRPSPIPAAKIAGKGSSAAAGGSSAGAGAGGQGNGPGGGGTDFSRFTLAQLIRNLSSGDYRSIGAGRLASGQAMVSLRITPNGLADNCRITRSSGDPAVDSGLCPLIEARLRFRPALDDQGRPIPYQLQFVARWRL
ncbi:MAG: TonB family protein [Sphingomicrobium sp.]